MPKIWENLFFQGKSCYHAADERIGLQEPINLKREAPMGEVVHTSRIKIVREKGPTRRAMIEGFAEPIYYGVHGGIKRFYNVEPDKEYAATLDHIIAATAG
jgi:hypothetical protein